MIFKAGNGAQIIDKIMINEDEALREYPFINHALVIVKSEDDYLFGYHKWRDDWETFCGLLETGEGIRECIARETEEELGLSNVKFEYLGIVHYYMPPDYWNEEWHEEYGALYGIKIKKDTIKVIECCRKDKEEIGEIAFVSELKKRDQKIDEINEALLRFF